MPATDAPLRPLDLGEQLDAAIQIYRARWRPMVKAVVVVTAPVLVLVSLVQASGGQADSFTRTDPDTGFVTFDRGEFLIFLAATLVATVGTVIATTIATAGVFRMVSGLYLGDAPDWRESLRFAFARVWSVLWVVVITGVAQLVGLVLCVLPALWMQGVFAVAIPALLVEDVRGVDAVRRSIDLVRGRFWPVFGVIILGSLMAGFVQSVFIAPLLALQFVEVNTVVSFLLRCVANVAATALTVPFTAALVMVVYFDLRVRKEGFDLFVLASRIGVDPPAGGFPRPPGPPPLPPWAGYGQPPPAGYGQPPPWAGYGQPPPAGYGQPPPWAGYGQPPPPGYGQPPPPDEGRPLWPPAPPGSLAPPGPPVPPVDWSPEAPPRPPPGGDRDEAS